MSEKPPILKRLRAAKAYADFTGHAPSSSYSVQLDDEPVAGYRLGSLTGIAYRARRDGKSEPYFHEFERHAQPDLVAKDDGSQLYITRGRYKVTDRGIVDMPLAMIVNPSARPSRRKASKGTKTMSRNRLGRFVRRARKPRRTQVAVFNANPIRRARSRRRTRRSAPALIAFKRNPSRRHHRRASAMRRRSYRRNPIEGGKGNLRIMSLVVPAAGIAAGAIGTELAMGYMTFIPANLTTGAMRHVTKGAIGLGLGYLVGHFVNRKAGEAFALGALTIAMHDAGKEALLAAVPGARFGAYLNPGAGQPGGGTRFQGVGYYSPAATERMNGVGAYMPAFHGRAADGGPQPEFGI